MANHGEGARVANVKILYIAGPGRSGSTLLGTLLGQPEGFVDVGEIWQYWRKRFSPGARATCACGKALGECEFWCAVASHLKHHEEREGLASVQDAIRMSELPRLMRMAKAGTLAESPFSLLLGDLYQGVAKTSGARVLIDSSKIPGQAIVASSLPEIDLYVLHLTRDPRSCVNSWRSLKESDAGAGRVKSRKTAQVLRDWNSWNFAAMTVLKKRVAKDRYLRIRYEDFADKPRETTQSILAFIGEAEATLPFIDDSTVLLEPSHIFAGNPDRFSAARRSISRRDRWRDELPRTTRIATQVFTSPLRQCLGYWR